VIPPLVETLTDPQSPPLSPGTGPVYFPAKGLLAVGAASTAEPKTIAPALSAATTNVRTIVLVIVVLP
jgi:hypothetical protein